MSSDDMLGQCPWDAVMTKIKNIITISNAEKNNYPRTFWMSRTREERVEAVETIREHYYQMLGYRTPPCIKKIITIT